MQNWELSRISSSNNAGSSGASFSFGKYSDNMVVNSNGTLLSTRVSAVLQELKISAHPKIKSVVTLMIYFISLAANGL